MASWNETSRGRFERPFDSMERFFLALGRGSASINREHWSVSIVARFEVRVSMKDTESALKQAWKMMRYDHPQMACTVCGDTKVYEVPDNAALDAWLDKTFIIAPPPATQEGLLKSFRPSNLATLHYLPHASEIIIHTSHWRTDFIGGLSLLNNLLTACIEPRNVQFGDEGKNLSPGRDEAARFSSPDVVQSRAVVEERERAVADLLTQLIGNLPSMGFSLQNRHQLPGGTLRSEMTLEARTTSAVISASRKRDLTITSAIHAALIVATQQVAAVPSTSVYTTWGIFNIRPLLQAPYNDSTLYPAIASIIGLPLALRSSTYADLAAQLKQFYKQPMPPSAGSHIREDVIVPFTNQIADIVGQPPPVEIPAPTEPGLSSIGIVDSYIKRNYGEVIEVKNFWVGVEMTTPQVQCYLWTWQGKMTLSAVYNETFHERQFVREFLKRVMDVLFAELEIQGE